MPQATDLITVDLSGAFLESSGIRFADWHALGPRLELARDEILAAVERDRSGEPAGSGAAQAAFVELPERTLDEYMERKASSPLGRLFTTAHRLQEATDRVVVVASGCCGLLPRVLFEACCDPYFNELSRGQRGARPRGYFAGNHLDNDATQGLLKLLSEGCRADRLSDRLALIAIGLDAEIEARVALGQLAGALRRFYGDDEALADELLLHVVPCPTQPAALAASPASCGGNNTFVVPAGVPGRFAAFSAAGLLPAAVWGLDAIRLLEGASAMNDHFRKAPPGRNAVLDLAALNLLAGQRCPAAIRRWTIWPQALQTLGLWYDRLAAGRPDGDPRRVRVVATAPSCEPSQDAARSRAEDSGEWVTNVVAHRWRCDSLPLEPSGADRDRDDRRHAQTLPGLMAAAIRATKEHQRRAGWPSADLHLPKISESVVGQLLQMLMLATAVEERLHAGPPADLTTPQRLY